MPWVRYVASTSNEKWRRTSIRADGDVVTLDSKHEIYLWGGRVMLEAEKFVIVKKLLENDDPDTEVTTLYLEHDNSWQRIVGGYYYHDNIDNKIEGFFAGLEVSGVNYETSEIGWEERF